MSNLPEPIARTFELRAQDDAPFIEDLWLRCFALGTMNTPTELAGFLRGELRPTRHEYNLVAVALNEWLSDIGVAQIVPYVERAELAGIRAVPDGVARSTPLHGLPNQTRSHVPAVTVPALRSSHIDRLWSDPDLIRGPAARGAGLRVPVPSSR